MSAYNDRIRRELGFGMIHWKEQERGARLQNVLAACPTDTAPALCTTSTDTGKSAAQCMKARQMP